MKTEHRLAEALKSMMATTPLNEISVISLTKRCHIKRQTFYYHFHDVYDLLTLVFLNEKVPNIEECKNTTEMVTLIYRYYLNNRLFIDASLSSAGKELFQEFVHNNCYNSILRFVNEAYDNKRLITNERKAIARFYALAYSNSIVYYLSVFKNKSLDGLLRMFCFEKDNCFSNAVANYIEFKGKMQ